MTDERAANATDRKLGQRVRSRRLEIGMSQEKLAELLGITFQQVQKYEKGVNRIAASRLFDIACALEIPVGKFFENLTTSIGKVRRDADYTDNMGAMLETPEGARIAAVFAKQKSRKVRQRLADLAEAAFGSA